MERQSFTEYLSPFYAYLITFTQGPNWRLKALFVCFICVFLFQFPEYQYLYKYAIAHTEQNPVYDNLVKQIANPFVNHSTQSVQHEAKMVFRLTVPLLARVLHLNIFGILALQAVLGLLMLWTLLTLIERITADRPTALLLVLAACFTYYGASFLHDIYCFFDAFGYAILALMLLTRRPLLIYGLSVAGCFLDERVLLASFLVVLWHSMRAPAEPVPQLRNPTISLAGLAVVAGWLTYAGLRFWLAAAYNLKSYGGAVGLDALRTNLATERTALGFVTGLESFWVLLALAILVLSTRRQWAVVVAFVIAFGPIAAGSFLVWDITRSLSFSFPVVLVALVILAHYFTRNSLRHLALVVAVFAVLIPNYYYQLNTYYSESIFEKAFRFWMLHNAPV